MRRIAATLCALCLLGTPGCRAVSDCLFRGFFGALAADYDSSRPTPEERGAAFDKYIEENIDNGPLPKTPQTDAAGQCGLSRGSALE